MRSEPGVKPKCRSHGSAALWLIWTLASVAATLALAAALRVDRASDHPVRAWVRTFFLPGPTTHGHHQIELACETCHTSVFGGTDVLQETCVECHGAELKEARDSHPRSKFTDPRNAERAAKLDATRCTTCHTEHRPGITQAVGLTLPNDYCVICHADVGKDRPTHVGLAFDTCASSGCHNFHDNRALYEDFLVKHASDMALLAKPTLPARDFVKVVEELASYPLDRFPIEPLDKPDHGAALRTTATIESDWLATAHAKAGVNCSGCHETKAQQKDGARSWVERPSQQTCAACHQDEVRGFRAGKHGMRQAAGLAPMQSDRARLPMKQDAAHDELSCTSCHAAHRFNTQNAAVDACLGCHADRHSLAYEKSPHAALWRKEVAGELPPGSGVSCASCHMPRVEHRTDDVRRVLVQHNQNDVLRPSDKMVRPVCLSCHGLAFSLDALADRQLALRNFSGRPTAHIRSIEMALDAERRADESRRKAQGSGS
jgi:hypothetical protein